MKNKKGILMAETLKIIMAVISIVFLVYLSVSLYGVFAQKTKIEQAKATLDQIFAEIRGLEDGEKGDYLVTSPKEWYFVVYEENQNVPSQCKDDNCLCICPSDKDLEGWKDYAGKINSLFYKDDKGIDKCEKEGVCKNIGKKVKIREVYFYDRDNPKEKGTNVAFVNWISFYDIPKELFFKEEAETLYISDVEIDSKILSNFLNKGVEFENQTMVMSNLILKELTNDCSVDWDINEWNGKIKVDEDVKRSIEEESEKYINELIDAGNVKGGKIFFNAIKQGRLNFEIIISKGDTKNCHLLEEKEICSNLIDEYNTMRWYLRVYTC